jgi:stage III sporulation protein AG
MGSGLFDFKKISGIFAGKKAVILLIIGFAGIALIFLSDFIHPSTVNSQQTQNSSVNSVASFERETENRLENIIGNIDGVGRVKVLVTVESGVENIYEQDNKTTTDKSQQNGGDGSVQTQDNNDNEQNPLVVNNSDGGQQAIVKEQLQPQILGVVVVCDGGGNADVQESVVDTVSTALGLPTNQISVNRMQPSTSSK